MFIFFILLILGVFVFVLSTFSFEKKDIANEKKEINNLEEKQIYKRKSFLSNTENMFYSKFKELENEMDINIVPQVNLGTIIDKNDTSNSYRNELFKNIDFGIFNSDYSEVLLLIELNDSTHNSQKRQYRDKRVKAICKNAGINLIFFYTNKPNEKEYVKNRIKNAIDEYYSTKNNNYFINR